MTGAVAAAELAAIPILDLLDADLQAAVTDPTSNAWAELNTLSRAGVSQAISMLVARVLDAVVSLVDSLLHDFDVVDLLTSLTERCADLLDIEAAGLLLADPLHRLRVLAATSKEARELELFQLQADEGPCVDCYASGEPVSLADIQVEADRWPRFVPAAVDAGFSSVHAVPMRAAGTCWVRSVCSASGLASSTKPICSSAKRWHTSRASQSCRSFRPPLPA